MIVTEFGRFQAYLTEKTGAKGQGFGDRFTFAQASPLILMQPGQPEESVLQHRNTSDVSDDLGESSCWVTLLTTSTLKHHGIVRQISGFRAYVLHFFPIMISQMVVAQTILLGINFCGKL